jgi:SAM-dependent methyltransferase
MLPYQQQVVDAFVKMLPPGARDILEIGSDMGCEVATAIARRTGANVVGVNPSPAFPAPTAAVLPHTAFLRVDGRRLPFADGSFDAVLSVATMEHVRGIDAFLAEVARVLRPKGLYYTEFSPIWSSAHGHHVYAVAGSREARFWKPGKNPIPDYGHLLMTPDEMRAYLRSGPCAEELIEPIIQWVYHGDDINRCHYEEYLEAFRK